MDPLINQLIAVALGLLFVGASAHKFSDIAGFQAILQDYQVVPGAVVPFAAVGVPLIEGLLGLSWFFSGFLSGITAIASAALLLVYASAIGINVLRGRIHIDCGCGFGGSTDSSQLISVSLVVRNAFLALLALSPLYQSGTRTLTGGDYATLVAAIIAVILLFAASNQLISNRAAINVWRKRRD